MLNSLIVGGSRGIGLELSRQLVRRGDCVTVTCRDFSAALSDLEVQIIEGIDVTCANDVGNLQRQLQGTAIDLLIHNAGILSSESLDDLNFDRIEQQFQVNTLGPLRVIHAMKNNLHSGSKVVIITSLMGSLSDNHSGGRYGYRISKAGANMAGLCLARDLEKQKIPVALLHPGLVATTMTGGNGVTPKHATQGLIRCINQLDMSNSGTFWHADGRTLPW